MMIKKLSFLRHLRQVISYGSETYDVSGRDLVGEAIIEDYEDRYHVLTTSTDRNDIRHTLIMMLNTNTDGRFETSETIETPYLSGKDMVIDATGKIFILGNRENRVLMGIQYLPGRT